MLPPVGTCVRVTIVLVGNATLQTPEAMPSATVQLRPAGELVIVPPPRDAGDARTVSVATAASIELEFTNERLHVLVANGGWDPASPEHPGTAPAPIATDDLSVGDDSDENTDSAENPTAADNISDQEGPTS